MERCGECNRFIEPDIDNVSLVHAVTQDAVCTSSMGKDKLTYATRVPNNKSWEKDTPDPNRPTANF